MNIWSVVQIVTFQTQSKNKKYFTLLYWLKVAAAIIIIMTTFALLNGTQFLAKTQLDLLGTCTYSILPQWSHLDEIITTDCTSIDAKYLELVISNFFLDGSPFDRGSWCKISLGSVSFEIVILLFYIRIWPLSSKLHHWGYVKPEVGYWRLQSC